MILEGSKLDIFKKQQGGHMARGRASEEEEMRKVRDQILSALHGLCV